MRWEWRLPAGSPTVSWAPGQPGRSQTQPTRAALYAHTHTHTHTHTQRLEEDAHKNPTPKSNMPTGTQTHKGYIHINNTSPTFIFKPYIQSNYIFNAIPPGRIANLSQLTKIQRTGVALPVLSFPLLSLPFTVSSARSQSTSLPPSLATVLSLSVSIPPSLSLLSVALHLSLCSTTHVFTVLRTASKSLGLRCVYYDKQVSIHSEAVCVWETERTGCECEWAEIVLTTITGLVQLTRHTNSFYIHLTLDTDILGISFWDVHWVENQFDLEKRPIG